MSKLNSEDTVGVTVPLYDVPAAALGLVLSTGTIRCGNWYAPDRLAGQEDDFAGAGAGAAGALVEVEVVEAGFAVEVVAGLVVVVVAGFAVEVVAGLTVEVEAALVVEVAAGFTVVDVFAGAGGAGAGAWHWSAPSVICTHFFWFGAGLV